MKHYRSIRFILTLMCLLVFAPAAFAAQENLTGLWQYQEIVEKDTRATDADNGPGVLLADLETMPLDLLDKVFGKLSYTLEFTEDQRFTVQIAVLYLRFTAQGNWSTENGKMTLVYDAITGFEKLWWLGGFDFLTHCDSEHTLTETVPYSMTDDRLIFYSNGADLIFAR